MSVKAIIIAILLAAIALSAHADPWGLLLLGASTGGGGGGASCGGTCTAIMVPGSIALNPVNANQFVVPFSGVIND